MRNHATVMIIAAPTTPPTTPPAMAPVLVWDELPLGWVVVDVGADDEVDVGIAVDVAAIIQPRVSQETDVRDCFSRTYSLPQR